MFETLYIVLLSSALLYKLYILESVKFGNLVWWISVLSEGITDSDCSLFTTDNRDNFQLGSRKDLASGTWQTFESWWF